MIGTSPPGPLRCGSTTRSVKAAATPASKALPPFSRILIPTAVAIQCVEVTTPKVPSISGLVVKGSGLILLIAVHHFAGIGISAISPRHELGRSVTAASIRQIAGNGGFGLAAFIQLPLYAPFPAKIISIPCCQSLATKQAGIRCGKTGLRRDTAIISFTVSADIKCALRSTFGVPHGGTEGRCSCVGCGYGRRRRRLAFAEAGQGRGLARSA